MSSDIGEQLLRDIRSDFAAELGDDNKRLGKLLKNILDGKADFNDVSRFSSECGEALSRAIAKNLSPDMLKNGTVTYEITRTLLRGVMEDNYYLINMAAQAVQQRLDNGLNIHIEPQKAAFPTSRVDTIASSIVDKTASDATIKRRMDAPVRNVTDSFYTDYVEENADFRTQAGLRAFVVRQTNGRCCDWCAALAGRYEYPDVPENLWAFHDNCTCSLLYSSAKTTNRHGRRGKSMYKDVLTGKEREKALKDAAKPVRFTRQQAENLQNNILNRLANSGNGGIINVELNEDELRALNAYISSDSYKINDKLRSGTELTDYEQSIVANLDSALQRMPKYEGVVYRSLEPSMIENLEEFWRIHTIDNIISYDAFTSSSTSTYDESMYIQMEILSKNGRDVRSYNPGEKEILFERNSKFRVTGIEKGIIYLEEV